MSLDFGVQKLSARNRKKDRKRERKRERKGPSAYGLGNGAGPKVSVIPNLKNKNKKISVGLFNDRNDLKLRSQPVIVHGPDNSV